MPGKLSRYATPRMLADLPIEAEKDKKASQLANFDFKEYAITLARLVADKQTRTPLAIGVNGAWGTGKTVSARMLTSRCGAFCAKSSRCRRVLRARRSKACFT